MAETVPEELPVSTARRVRLLVHVLSYEDLLAARTTVIRLDGARPVLQLCRGREGLAPGLQSPSELAIDDRWMSSRHATLESGAGGDVLSDVGSRNGTFVNGRRIESIALGDGDLIEVGHSLLCYRVVSEGDALALGSDGDPVQHGPTRTYCAEVAAAMRALDRIARSTEPVLIVAETGCGKEHAAQTVHRTSGRAGELVAIDCGAIPEPLFESTFFGHVRGAFTGASDRRTGALVQADGGTLFLDEIGNLPPSSQAKLLRVLEQGEVTPLGASQPVRTDLRVVAATNRALESDFRSDLLARIAGLTLRLPPLRRRREDLGVLGSHFLRDLGVARAAITTQAARALFNHAFPGNIRQLRAMLRAAVLLAGDRPIDVDHLGGPAAPRGDEADDDDERPATGRRTAPAREELERALEDVGGNVVAAARQLNTRPRQLYRWIQQHELSLERYRS